LEDFVFLSGGVGDARFRWYFPINLFPFELVSVWECRPDSRFRDGYLEGIPEGGVLRIARGDLE
jgi:hypothetical protein